jgi:hypothetical protein
MYSCANVRSGKARYETLEFRAQKGSRAGKNGVDFMNGVSIDGME